MHASQKLQCETCSRWICSGVKQFFICDLPSVTSLSQLVKKEVFLPAIKTGYRTPDTYKRWGYRKLNFIQLLILIALYFSPARLSREFTLGCSALISDLQHVKIKLFSASTFHLLHHLSNANNAFCAKRLAKPIIILNMYEQYEVQRC